jgi:hypothetical protein
VLANSVRYVLYLCVELYLSLLPSSYCYYVKHGLHLIYKPVRSRRILYSCSLAGEMLWPLLMRSNTFISEEFHVNIFEDFIRILRYAFQLYS